MIHTNNYHHMKQMHDLCNKHKNEYVLVSLADGTAVDGIIIDIDEENVHLAVPALREESNERYSPGFGYPWYGYGYPPFGYPPYGYGPYGRIRRLILPLAALTALSALPW